MANFLVLQERVERRVIDLPTAVQDEVPTLVNRAIRKLQEKHNFKVMDYVPSTLVTNLNTRVLGAIPTDRKELWGNPYELRFDNTVRKLTFAGNSREFHPIIDHAATGEPRFLTEGNYTDAGVGSYEVWPLPDEESDWADGDYRIVIPYRRYLPDLSADGDSNWFSVNAEDWIVYQATGNAFAMDWDEERAVFWWQRAQGEFHDVEMADKYARLAGVDTLVPHHGADDAMIRE